MPGVNVQEREREKDITSVCRCMYEENTVDRSMTRRRSKYKTKCSILKLQNMLFAIDYSHSIHKTSSNVSYIKKFKFIFIFFEIRDVVVVLMLFMDHSIS